MKGNVGLIEVDYRNASTATHYPYRLFRYAASALLFVFTSPSLLRRLAKHLCSLGRVSEAIHVMEGFVRTENALPASHLLVVWCEKLNREKEAKQWLEYGVKREEPEAILLHVRYSSASAHSDNDCAELSV